MRARVCAPVCAYDVAAYEAQRAKPVRKPPLTSGGSNEAEMATPITDDVPESEWLLSQEADEYLALYVDVLWDAYMRSVA